MEQITKKEFGLLLKNNMALYANEVNEDRAIPSIYDGLKPSMRRILYWLYKNKGITNFLGCAQIVGGVLGDFHPRGDSSVYGALVRLSQPLILPLPLIDFHGNNGSLSDPPAAMRYTKAKLSHYGTSLLSDIDIPGVIEWKDNYNETQKEPAYLLGSIGTLNLLISSNIGIGLGLASNFLPHNVQDVIDLVKFRMENPNCKFEDLPTIYPSFNKNGTIVNKRDIANIYKTGKGTVILRGKYHWEEDILYITELPYRVDATSIKKYLNEHPINGISEIYEQNGTLKIYAEKGASHEQIEKDLLKRTALQTSYSVNMTATDINGKPRLWTLLDILDVHIKLQHNRIIKTAEYNKGKAEKELHIQEGLEKALNDIDKVINIIRNSESPLKAESNLVQELCIDNIQAKAILDIRLGKLTHLEIEDVRQKISNLKAQIEYEEKVISDKELRESMYLLECSQYSTNTNTKTECLDLISVGSGDNLYEDSHILWDENGYTISADFDDLHADEIHLNDEYYIITNTLRGFSKKGKDFLNGERTWKELLGIEDDEQVILFISKEKLRTSGEYLELLNKDDNKSYRMHISYIVTGASSRGKKIVKNKYNIRHIKSHNNPPEIPTIK